MKKFLFTALMMAFGSIAFAQTFSDSFETYKSGDYLAQSNSKWTTWGNKPGTSQDVKVTNVKSHSGNNSIYFTSNQTGGGPTDVVLPFGGQLNTGSFVLEMWMYVESGKPAYFNIQTNSTPGVKWSIEMYMNADSTFIINNTDGALLTGTYPQGKWIDLKLSMNLNSSTWELFINNTSKGSFINTVNQIASLDLYSYQGSSFYVDDINYNYTPVSLTNLNAAAINLTNTTGLAGQTVIPRAYLRNLGKSIISSCDVSVNYNGNTITKSLSGLNIASTDSFSTDITAGIQLASSNSNAVLTVSNINGLGKDNDTTDDAISVAVNPLIPAAGKMVIAEEFTGTWCGYCPRGAVFLDYMANKYGKYFQGIAVHNNDPMSTDDYNGVSQTFIKSYPTIMTNRMDTIDPLVVEANFLKNIVIPPVGTIVNGAEYNKDSALLRVSLTVTFNANETGAYRMACVLAEDSVTGTSTGYDQHNYYSGGSIGIMGGYEKLTNPVPAKDMVYNHVARIIAPSFYGLNTGLPSSIVAGTPYNLIYKFSVSAYNVNHLHIAGLLFKPDGTIDNGSSTTLSEAETNGFQSVGTLAGINENIPSAQKLSIYPNPASDRINISGITGNEKIYITDMSGKEVLSYTNASSFTASIPINALNNGIYIVKVICANEVYSTKVMIQK